MEMKKKLWTNNEKKHADWMIFVDIMNVIWFIFICIWFRGVVWLLLNSWLDGNFIEIWWWFSLLEMALDEIVCVSLDCTENVCVFFSFWSFFDIFCWENICNFSFLVFCFAICYNIKWEEVSDKLSDDTILCSWCIWFYIYTHTKCLHIIFVKNH